MIATSIFLVVVMIGMSALLNANLIQQKSQNMRSIMDNLSFIMEDMSRNLRTGYNYHCGTTVSETPLSCAFGSTVFFEAAAGTIGNSVDQWGYKIESLDGGVTYNISRSVNGEPFEQLNSEEIKIDGIFSGFSVIGAEPPTGDTQQPFVIIRLVGKITYRGVDTPFLLQTSVSQRLLDR